MKAGIPEKSETCTLIEGGYSWDELVEAIGSERTTAMRALANKTIKIRRLLDIGAPIRVLAECATIVKGSSARLKELLAEGVYIKTLLDGGWQVRKLVDEGVRLRALTNAGIHASSLTRLGLSPKTLVAEGLQLGSFVLPSGTRFVLLYYPFQWVSDRQAWIVEDFSQGVYEVRPLSSVLNIQMDMAEMLRHGLMLI